MAFVMMMFFFTERASRERQKEASNRLQKEAVLSFIIMTDCSVWHQCQVKYFLELTPMVMLWSSLPGKRCIVENYAKGFTCWHRIFLVGEECIAIFLTWTEAVRKHSSGSYSTV